MTQFEFGNEHDREFTKAGYWMGQFGLLAMFLGVVDAIGGLLDLSAGVSPESLAGLLSAAILFTLGLLVRRSGKSFTAVATSEGQDLDHLMNAVGSLKQLFRLMVLMAVGLIVLALVAGIAVGLMSGG